MKKVWKFVMKPLQSENNYAGADSYYALGAIIVFALLSVASLVELLVKKLKSAISKRKTRHQKAAGNHAQVAHA